MGTESSEWAAILLQIQLQSTGEGIFNQRFEEYESISHTHMLKGCHNKILYQTTRFHLLTVLEAGKSNF